MKTFKHEKVIPITVGCWITSPEWWSGWYQVVQVRDRTFAIVDPQDIGRWIYFEIEAPVNKWKVVVDVGDIPNGDNINRFD